MEDRMRQTLRNKTKIHTKIDFCKLIPVLKLDGEPKGIHNKYKGLYLGTGGGGKARSQ
jgi:hypothetical protein